MNRIFVGALVGLTVILAAPSSALSFHCVARGTNGAFGSANSGLHWKAQQAAWRACVAAGGSRYGGVCAIDYCR
jgi:hypothetical protein